LGSAFERTIGAAISSPFASATPRTRPPRATIRATGAPVRISAPKLRAADAMAFVIAPMPPSTWP
jgi:hypothetical protein